MSEKEDIVNRAIIFATRAHEGMYRKGTKLPYIVHPIEACAVAASITDDPVILAAAVLHDVIEDTDYGAEEIRELFGEEVLCLIASDTEDKREELPAEQTWKARKQETIDYLKEKASYGEKIIVLSDKVANMRSIYRDYLEIGDKIWERFNEKKKTMQQWYYEAILENVQELADTYAYQEYQELLKKVFG